MRLPAKVWPVRRRRFRNSLARQGTAGHGEARQGGAGHGIYTRDNMTTTLFPSYRQAAKTILESETNFFPDSEISSLLQEPIDSQKYRFMVMSLQQNLLNEHGINLIRSSDKDLGKGYKIATGSESLRITVRRLSQRVMNAAQKQGTVLSIIDRSELPEDESTIYDRNIIKNGLLQSFLRKTSRAQLTENSQIRIDVPKMITA